MHGSIIELAVRDGIRIILMDIADFVTMTSRERSLPTWGFDRTNVDEQARGSGTRANNLPYLAILTSDAHALSLSGQSW